MPFSVQLRYPNVCVTLCRVFILYEIIAEEDSPPGYMIRGSFLSLKLPRYIPNTYRTSFNVCRVVICERSSNQNVPFFNRALVHCNLHQWWRNICVHRSTFRYVIVVMQLWLPTENFSIIFFVTWLENFVGFGIVPKFITY